MERDRINHRNFLENINSGKITLARFSLDDPEGVASYSAFRQGNPNVSVVDNRLPDLISLYQRFHPGATGGFRSWLREEGFTPPFDRQGSVLALPRGYNPNGELIWQVTAVLPEHLQRQMQEASGWKLMDSPDGKVETRKILYEDIDLIVIGASVGSQIASTLVTALGVNHLTIVDPDVQDAIGTARVDDPKLGNFGKLKTVKMVHSLLEVAPYLKYKAIPERLSPENIDEILTGLMPDNTKRRLVIVEEVDDLEAKDLLRQKMRQRYSQADNVLLISIADIGRANIKAVIEEPMDPPYAGAALNLTADPYGFGVSRFEGDESPAGKAFTGLSKIIATYNLGDELPLELTNALRHRMSGEISSFEQSGLATRLAGVVASQALLSWLEGSLSTRQLNLNLASFLDTRMRSNKFLQNSKQALNSLKNDIGIRS